MKKFTAALLVCSMFNVACSSNGFNVSQLGSVDSNIDKISFARSKVESGETSTNTIQNNVTFQDAKILIKETYVTVYESGTVKLSGKLETLTPSTVNGFEIADKDLGKLSDWTIFNNNNGSEYTLYSPKYTYDVSADGQARIVEIQIRFNYNYITQTYFQTAITGHLIDGQFSANDTGNETYGVILQ